MTQQRRWYDNDNVLKEALELLQIQTDETQAMASEFLVDLQEQVAKDVIEHISELVSEYSETGNRWHDKDPILLKAVELLRHAKPKMQRIAALKLLLALEKQSFDNITLIDTEEE